MLFATPDFGASAFVEFALLIFWFVVAVACITGLFIGIGPRFRQSGFPWIGKTGRNIVLDCCLIPVVCYFTPRFVVRAFSGNFPVSRADADKVDEGTTRAQVRAMLGPPQVVEDINGGKSDVYWLDSFGIRYLGVDYGDDNRVSNTWGRARGV